MTRFLFLLSELLLFSLAGKDEKSGSQRFESTKLVYADEFKGLDFGTCEIDWLKVWAGE